MAIDILELREGDLYQFRYSIVFDNISNTWESVEPGSI